MSTFGPPVGGLRTIRIVLVLIACGVMLNTCGVVVSFVFNADRVDQINEERARNVERNCQDINARHDNTLKALDILLVDRLAGKRLPSDTPLALVSRELRAALAGVPPAQRRQMTQSRDSSRVLIESLTPRRRCAALARAQVDTTK